MPEDILLSVIMPVYNERDTIAEIVRRVEASPVRKELVIVDDGSTDGSREIIRGIESAAMPITKIFHPVNRGKGAAIRTGLESVKGDVVIIQDADLEYDPNDFVKILEPIRCGEAKVVYGTRYWDPKNLPRLYLANYIATRLLTFMANALYGVRITDESTCYKAFHVDVLQDIRLRCERFEFCPEITAKVAKRGHKIVETPIHYTGRTKEAGKKIGWRDGVEAIWTLLKYRVVD
ncbi:MAG TPA: glycosyltransferase family 2 protein [Candidatus Brocadiia bacterium]|nr:glycosyltransferase family 2 protein [Candidatus Brocadiia bacterium]